MKNTTIIKLLLIISAISLCICALSISSSAEIVEGTCGEELTWSLDTETGVLDIRGNGNMYDYSQQSPPWNKYQYTIKAINFPSDIQYVDPLAFKDLVNCESIKLNNDMPSYPYYSESNCLIREGVKVLVLGCTGSKIPQNIIQIGDHAFYGKKISSIMIPRNTTVIGNYAFAECTELKTVDFVYNQKPALEIKSYAFKGCKKLETIKLPDSISTLGEGVFMSSGLTAFDIPSTVTEIPPYFFSKSMLKQMIFPDTVKTVGEGSFKDCSKLEKVIMSDSITSLGEDSFDHCIHLTDLTLSKGLTEIPPSCFVSCSMDSVTIPEGVTVIRQFAFYGGSYKSFYLPESLESIEQYGITSYRMLENIVIPKNVSSLVHNSVDVFPTISEDNPYYHTDSGCIIETATKTLIIGSVDSVIPDDGSVTVIGGSAFIHQEIKEITLPDTIKELQHGAFAYTPLERITLSKNLESIGKNAFVDCVYLQEIYIPDSVKVIDDSAFYCCTRLASVRLPERLDYLGQEAFYACSALKTIDLPENITELPASIFAGCYDLYFPEIPEQITKINSAALISCLFPETLEIKGSVKYIGPAAFADCNSVKKLIINEGVEYIGESAFTKCLSLETVVLPNNIDTIEINAFQNSPVKNLELPEDFDFALYPNTIRELGKTANVYINSEKISRDPSIVPLFNCGSVGNIALKSEYAIDAPWCEYYDKAENGITYNGTEYILYKTNNLAIHSHFYIDETGHYISNTKKVEHNFSRCPGICNSCNYKVDTEVHGKSEIVQKDDVYHWQKCLYCPEGHNMWGETKHTWDKGKITLAPTLDAPGKIWHKCVDCGYNKIFPLAQLQPDPTVTPEPTLTPDATLTPEPSVTPKPTPSPTITPDEAITPESTPTPEQTVEKETEAPDTNTPNKDPLEEANERNSVLITLLVIAGVILLVMSAILILPLFKKKQK